MTTSFHYEWKFRCKKSSLTLPLFIEMPLRSQESEGSCIYMLGVTILPLSTILYLCVRGNNFASLFLRFWICVLEVTILPLSFYDFVFMC
jgi:hypothetical protein